MGSSTVSGERSPLEITVQYFAGCPHWQELDRRLATLVAGGLEASIRHERIDDKATAAARRFRGSPTLLLDGIDPFADPEAPVGLSCRLYRTDRGLAGSPTLEELRAAIAEAKEH